MSDVAIIGAGFSGTLVAAHLLRSCAPAGTRVTLIERRGRFGCGTAYGTESDRHLLNVPAGRMSAFEAEPDDFVKFARRHDASASGASFVPRRIYGRYLEQLLDDAERVGHARGVRLMRCAGEAIGLRFLGGRPEISLAALSRQEADRVVLALGNLSPTPPAFLGDVADSDAVHVNDPWRPHALDVDPDESVLVIGTGLTMIDVVLSLDAAGHRGPIHAISRHGLLPQPHRPGSAPPHVHPPLRDVDLWLATARSLLRELRDELRRAELVGVDWREVVTALREDTAALWRRLPDHERARFLRHLRPYWEVHRHRAAPQAAARVAELRENGRLEVIAGRVVECVEVAQACGVRAHVRLRRRAARCEEQRRVGRIINATGPTTDLTAVRDPLVRGLIADGRIRSDRLGLGLETEEHGAVLDRCGAVSPTLFAVGPLRKAAVWENTAVPELRREALSLATHLGSTLRASSPSALHGFSDRP